mmetsp:Transcript_53648/g.120977  ORF Transcript_53648/g.120977 Transcript_53648/m.120977 type:complete len:259 (-) Transcript_53648:1193-1969(-)
MLPIAVGFSSPHRPPNEFLTVQNSLKRSADSAPHLSRENADLSMGGRSPKRCTPFAPWGEPDDGDPGAVDRAGAEFTRDRPGEDRPRGEGSRIPPVKSLPALESHSSPPCSLRGSSPTTSSASRRSPHVRRERWNFQVTVFLNFPDSVGSSKLGVDARGPPISAEAGPDSKPRWTRGSDLWRCICCCACCCLRAARGPSGLARAGSSGGSSSHQIRTVPGIRSSRIAGCSSSALHSSSELTTPPSTWTLRCRYQRVRS